MSYAEFLERLSTFSPQTWISVFPNASPLVCARYGWRNAAFQILKCDTCGVEFPLTPNTTSNQTTEQAAEANEILLSETHKEGCIWRGNPNQKSFMHLQLSPLEKIGKAFLARLDATNSVWDLPKIKDLESEEVQEEMKLLVEFLHGRGMKKLANDQLEADVTEALRKRMQTQMLLALLGWNLKWSSRLVYLTSENGKFPSFVEGQENDPSETHFCVARQSYITCDICNAKVGLWGHQTEALLSRRQFQQLAHKMAKSKDTPTLKGIKRKREREIKEKKEQGLESNSFQEPAFGLKRFKRTKESQIKHLLAPKSITDTVPLIKHLTQEEEDVRFSPILSGPKLSVIEAHRFFCPYRTDWKSLLKALVGI